MGGGGQAQRTAEHFVAAVEAVFLAVTDARLGYTRQSVLAAPLTSDTLQLL